MNPTLRLVIAGLVSVAHIAAAHAQSPSLPLERTATTVSGHGNPDGPIHRAQIGGTKALVVEDNGDVIFFDFGYSTLRKLDRASGRIETLAGAGRAGFADGALLEAAGCASATRPLSRSTRTS